MRILLTKCGISVTNDVLKTNFHDLIEFYRQKLNVSCGLDTAGTHVAFSFLPLSESIEITQSEVKIDNPGTS